MRHGEGRERRWRTLRLREDMLFQQPQKVKTGEVLEAGGAGISGEKLPNLFINLNGIGWRAKKSLERRRGTPRPYVAGPT